MWSCPQKKLFTPALHANMPQSNNQILTSENFVNDGQRTGWIARQTGRCLVQLCNVVWFKEEFGDGC